MMKKPLFFPVSVRKLVLMSIFTLGLYELYWLFKNWQLIKEREHSGIIPVLRAIFGVFFCYGLFRRIREEQVTHWPQRPAINARGLAAGWIACSILGNFPSPIDLIGLGSVFWLIPVQNAVNAIHSNDNVAIAENDDITPINLIFIVISLTLFYFYLTQFGFLNGG